MKLLLEKLSRPVFFENSKLPVWLSKLAPIDVWAFSSGFWVWCRGELSERTKQHETIHYRQQLELLFVGQWVLYGLFYLIGFLRYRDGEKAYFQIPFEQEAYENEKVENYLDNREAYAWRHYSI